MPTFTGGDRIYFYYNCGDYNNDLKTLSHKPKSQIHPWFSHINREHPIVFRQKLQETNFLYFGAHTQKKFYLLSP